MSLADVKRGLSQGQSESTRVINGRLYQAEDETGLYHPVPRGMDDARDSKNNPPSNYYVAGDEAHEIFTPERLERKLQDGATAYLAKTEDAEPVSFLKTEETFAIAVLDEEGKIHFQTVEPGSYIGVGEDGNCFAVSEEDFAEDYEVVSEGPIHQKDESPKLEDAEDVDHEDISKRLQPYPEMPIRSREREEFPGFPRELPEIPESESEADSGCLLF